MQTVTELRQVLQAIEADGQGDHIVVLSRDEEGNGFSTLEGVWIGTWNGEDLYDEDEEVYEPVQPVVVLWP